MTRRTSGPRLLPGSPPPPGDPVRTAGADGLLGIVIDTSVFLSITYLRPLLVSASVGDLAVYWSPPIQREIAKVVVREVILRVLRDASGSSPADAIPAVRRAVNSVSVALEDQLAEAERVFRLVTDLSSIRDADVEVIADPADRMVLRTALASGAQYILSLDNRHLPHGTVFHGVECWHPDTYLTTFYQQNPEAYRRATRGARTLPAAIRRLLP